MRILRIAGGIPLAVLLALLLAMPFGKGGDTFPNPMHPVL